MENDRLELVKEVKGLSIVQFNTAPSGKWSINQILAHLIAAERLSVQYINKKIPDIQKVENTGLKEEIIMVLLRLSQRLPFKFKAPRIVVENTPSYNTLEELIADWEQERRELYLLLEKFDESQLRKKIYKHVRAGKLNIQQALIFLREHYIHHRPQVLTRVKSESHESQSRFWLILRFLKQFLRRLNRHDFG